MDTATASERLAVAVAAPAHDMAIVQTSMTIEKWDADQAAWVLGRMGHDQALDALKRGANVTLAPALFRRHSVRPYEVWHKDNCNLITQQGWVALLGGVAGTTMTTKFGATAARIGVGTVATAAAFGDTKLGGDTGAASTTSYYKLVSSAPTISTAAAPSTLVFTSTFGTAVANFAWAEFGTDNGTADSVNGTGAVFFNHGIQSMGTKASGQTWTATETISFGFPSGAGTVS